jgi:hypothetical protein
MTTLKITLPQLYAASLDRRDTGLVFPFWNSIAGMSQDACRLEILPTILKFLPLTPAGIFSPVNRGSLLVRTVTSKHQTNVN